MKSRVGVNRIVAAILLTTPIVLLPSDLLAQQANPSPQPATRPDKPASVPPVYLGADPHQIPLNDVVITQIIPVKNLDVAKLRADLMPLYSPNALVTTNAKANSLVIVDTSSHIHYLAEVIQSLDVQGADMAHIPGRALPSHDFGTPQFVATITEPIADIVAPMDGTIANIAVGDGQAVKADQLLLEFDAGETKAELKAATAQLDLAKAHLAQIAAAGATPEQRDEARAQILVDEAAVDVRRLRLNAMQLKAPFNATLTTIDVKAGQYVRAGTILTRAVGTEEMGVSFLVSEQETIPRVGGKVSFKGPNTLYYTGVISFVSPVVDKGTNTVEVRAKIGADKNPIKPGSTVILTVEEAAKP